MPTHVAATNLLRRFISELTEGNVGGIRSASVLSTSSSTLSFARLVGESLRDLFGSRVEKLNYVLMVGRSGGSVTLHMDDHVNWAFRFSAVPVCSCLLI